MEVTYLQCSLGFFCLGNKTVLKHSHKQRLLPSVSSLLLMTVQSALSLHTHACSNENRITGLWSAWPDHPDAYSQGGKPGTFQEKSSQISKSKQILDAYGSKINRFRSVILLQIWIALHLPVLKLASAIKQWRHVATTCCRILLS